MTTIYERISKKLDCIHCEYLFICGGLPICQQCDSKTVDQCVYCVGCYSGVENDKFTCNFKLKAR